MQVEKLICQLIANLRRGRTRNSKLIRSFMSFLYGGRISTDKLIFQLAYLFIIPFPVWAGFKIKQSKQEMELELNPGQTGNGAISNFNSNQIWSKS